MAVSKSTIKNNTYKKRAAKKLGLDIWRYHFFARNITTGLDVPFFIELYIENPAVTPDAFTLMQKPKADYTTMNIQDALTADMSSLANPKDVIPSFVAVRAGIFGDVRKQINVFYAPEKLKSDKKHFNIEIESNHFTDDALSGSLTVTKKAVTMYPETMSQAGTIQWNLHYERNLDFPKIESKAGEFYLPSGIHTAFSGRLVLDQEEYMVLPKGSYGYTDKISGPNLPVPMFHISSSRLTSIFSQKLIEDSAFSVQGVYNNKVCLFAKLENDVFNISPSGISADVIWNCTQVPDDEDNEQLHWSASFTNKTYVIDVDMFCEASSMLVFDYEVPSGNNKVNKVLSGSKGTGEIRVYKRVKKNLELIHHVKVENALCEFGSEDTIEE